MMIFWLVCAALVGIGLAFVLPPLLQRPGKETEPVDTSSKEANVEVYRDQLAELESERNSGLVSDEQYQQDRQEYEQRLLEDVATIEQPAVNKSSGNSRNAAYILAVALPVVAVVFYLRVGHPSALSATPAPAGRSMAAAPQSPTAEEDFSPQRIEANVAALAKKLEQTPDDVSGWTMLGRSYSSLGKYSEASAAYKKASALKPDDADLLADYAFTLAMASDKKLAGEPAAIVARALKLDPENPKALELAGSVAYEANDFQLAIKHWQKLLTRTSPDSDIGRALTERIEEARSRIKK
ncbi:MAG TPA: c-type cytochrome biogenesis protein CcmI [Pyrinomonadaceae bacterium]|nr:c-type cytochrome biogenesis protein CcmI [Pyrinomonadaceae bacterium]